MPALRPPRGMHNTTGCSCYKHAVAQTVLCSAGIATAIIDKGSNLQQLGVGPDVAPDWLVNKHKVHKAVSIELLAGRCLAVDCFRFPPPCTQAVAALQQLHSSIPPGAAGDFESAINSITPDWQHKGHQCALEYAEEVLADM